MNVTNHGSDRISIRVVVRAVRSPSAAVTSTSYIPSFGEYEKTSMVHLNDGRARTSAATKNVKSAATKNARVDARAGRHSRGNSPYVRSTVERIA